MVEQLWGWLLFFLALFAALWYVVGAVFFLALGLVSRREDAARIERWIGFTRRTVDTTEGRSFALDGRWIRLSTASRPELTTALKAHSRFAWPLFLLASAILLLATAQMMAMLQAASSAGVLPAVWSIALAFAGATAFFGTLWAENWRWDQRAASTWRVVQLGDRLFEEFRKTGTDSAELRACATELQTAVVGTLLERRRSLERLDWKVRMRQPVAAWIASAQDEVFADELLLECWVGDACDLTSLVVPGRPAITSGFASRNESALSALDGITSSRLKQERPTRSLRALFIWTLGITVVLAALAVCQQVIGSGATTGDMLASFGDDPLGVVKAVGSIAAGAVPLIALLPKVIRRTSRI